MNDEDDRIIKDEELASAATSNVTVRFSDKQALRFDKAKDTETTNKTQTSTVKGPVVNLQLYLWEEAKKLLRDLENTKKGRERGCKAFLLIDLIGLSLATLAGANHSKKEGQNSTPSLKKFYSGGLNSEKDERFWDLRETDLWDDFLKLDNLYKDVVKHFEQDKFEKLKEIKTKDLKVHLKTAGKIWHRILVNKQGGKAQAKRFEEYLKD